MSEYDRRYNEYLTRRQMLEKSARLMGWAALMSFLAGCRGRAPVPAAPNGPGGALLPVLPEPTDQPGPTDQAGALLVVKNYDDTNLHAPPETAETLQKQADAPMIPPSSSANSYISVPGVTTRDIRGTINPRPGRRPLGSVEDIVLHHSVVGNERTSAVTVANADASWDAPPYGLIVDYDGILNLAWPVFELLTNHVADYNPHAVAVSVPGNMTLPGVNYSPQQADTIYKTLVYLHGRYPNAKIVGHQELPGMRTACPADDGMEMVKRVRNDLKVEGIDPVHKVRVERQRAIGQMLAAIANMQLDFFLNG